MAAPKPPEKKGEVNELRALLRTVNTDKDTKRKRDVIKKVIAYMTLGIDVSRLFSDMILACNTRDLVVKKMVYLYLCSYAQSNAELTLLAINTLQKDCRDEDPMVRGLALRSLTGLRLMSVLEYVLAPLRAALTDSSGYVRQAAVIGVLKVFHLSPSSVKDGGLVDVLYGMLRDREPQVVINCISVLNEILAEEGGIAVNQAIIHYLLTRFREFSDWGQCAVLDLLAKYSPASEEELFGMMNLLDPALKVANSAVVLATTKAFIALTGPLPDLHRQVFLRLKTPLLTALASSSPEVSFPVLSHIQLIVATRPAAAVAGVFDEDYKAFFCKFNEPACVKALKMGILPRIACAATAREVVAELTEYATGVDADLARQAVRAIGEVAVRIPPAAEAVVESLLEGLDAEADFVRAESVVTMQDLLRKYPERAPAVIPSLQRALKRMEDARGRAAVIWMIGEYGHLIDDAPYLLEPIIDEVKSEESVTVRNELLTATVKLFFKRPPEVQRMLGRLFKAFLADGVTASVRDRALLYYRLLKTSVADAGSVIGGERPSVAEFHDEQAPEVRDVIWSEFNSLSVVYGKPSAEFVSADHLIVPLDAPGARAAAAALAASDDTSLLGSGGDAASVATDASGAAAAAAAVGGAGIGAGAGASPAVAGAGFSPAGGAYGGAGAGGGYGSPAPAAVAAPAPVASPAVDLLSDDLLGIGIGSGPAASSGGAASSLAGLYGSPAAAPVAAPSAGLGLAGLYGGAPAAAPAPVAPAAAAAAPSFRAGVALDAPTYQARWGALPLAGSHTLRGSRVPSTAELEGVLRAGHVLTIASGDVGPQLKLYVYAGMSASPEGMFGAAAAAAGPVSLHLWELLFDKATGVYSVTQKSEAPAAAAAAFAAFTATLRPLLA